jgi:hypothetical protein
MKRMIAITMSPGAATAVDRLIAPSLEAFTTAPPAPTSTSKNVPSSSEKSRRHSCAGSSNLPAAPGYSSASSARSVVGAVEPSCLPSTISLIPSKVEVPGEGRSPSQHRHTSSRQDEATSEASVHPDGRMQAHEAHVMLLRWTAREREPRCRH